MKEKKKYCDRERPNSKAPLGFLTIQQRIRFLRLNKHMKGKTIYYNRYPANYYWIISENPLSWECHIILISDCLPFTTDVFQTWQIGWEKTCFFHSRYVKALASFFQSFETFTIRGPDFLEFISLCPFFLF